MKAEKVLYLTRAIYILDRIFNKMKSKI